MTDPPAVMISRKPKRADVKTGKWRAVVQLTDSVWQPVGEILRRFTDSAPLFDGESRVLQLVDNLGNRAEPVVALRERRRTCHGVWVAKTYDNATRSWSTWQTRRSQVQTRG